MKKLGPITIERHKKRHSSGFMLGCDLTWLDVRLGKTLWWDNRVKRSDLRTRSDQIVGVVRRCYFDNRGRRGRMYSLYLGRLTIGIMRLKEDPYEYDEKIKQSLYGRFGYFTSKVGKIWPLTVLLRGFR